MTKKAKLSITKSIDLIIRTYEPYVDGLSEDEVRDIDQLKECYKLLCGENISFTSSMLTYIIRIIR